MAGELDASLADVLPHRAPEASTELACDMHGVNPRRLREALECVMSMKLVLDLLLHPCQPRRRHAPCFETGTVAEFCEQRDNGAREGCRAQIVPELELRAQLKREPMGWRSAHGVEALKIGQGVRCTQEHSGIDTDRQAPASRVRRPSGSLRGRVEHQRSRATAQAMATPFHLIAAVDDEAQSRPGIPPRRNDTCGVPDDLTQPETRDIEGPQRPHATGTVRDLDRSSARRSTTASLCPSKLSAASFSPSTPQVWSRSRVKPAPRSGTPWTCLVSNAHVQ